jgi:hypothetical protein
MGAYKQLTTKDVVLTPFEAQKVFTFSGGAITGSNVGIDILLGINSTSSLDLTPTGLYKNEGRSENVRGVYHNIKQLYYSNYLTSSKGDSVSLPILVKGINPEDDRDIGSINSPRYDNYLQSSLTQSRYFPTEPDEEISVISIPSKLYGDNIVPSTFKFTLSLVDDVFIEVKDDGEGNLIVSSLLPRPIYSEGVYGISSYGEDTTIPLWDKTISLGQNVGQIFYSHGVAVLTTSSLSLLALDEHFSIPYYGTSSYGISLYSPLDFSIQFNSSYKLYEHQYKCVINENEFTSTLNPSSLSGSKDDTYYDFITGSDFTPYITTVGLYNEQNELLVVGKLSFPLPISNQIDTTIIVNFDT